MTVDEEMLNDQKIREKALSLAQREATLNTPPKGVVDLADVYYQYIKNGKTTN